MKRKGNPTLMIVLAIFLLIASIVAMGVGISGPAELKNVEDIIAADMSTDYSYEIEELFIVDHYMTISGDSKGGSNGKYYVVGFYGEDEKFYLASMFADGDKALQAKLDDYINDTNAKIGDLEISACFKTRNVSAVDGDDDFYDNAVSRYKSVFLGEGITCVDTALHLDYVCENAEDYASEASTTPIIIVGVVFVALSIGLIFVANKAKKKLKAEEEARARFNENQPQETESYQGPEF